MAKMDYSLQAAADCGADVYVLDKPMINETGKALVYPFGFEPTLHLYRMNTLDKLKMGNNIFVGAMADVFGEWVPDSWIEKVIKECMARPQHNYLFLTKNPRRYIQYGVPTGYENMWYGTTITGKRDADKVLQMTMNTKTFVSIEPFHEPFLSEDLIMICSAVDWIIIGAETGRRAGRIIPNSEWVKDIMVVADEKGVPVFMKDSLIPIMGEENMRRDFPMQLQHKSVSKKMEKKLYDQCCSCKVRKKKSDMIALLARSQRGEQPKQFGFMCKQCFEEFCSEKGLNIPALAKFAVYVDRITFGPGKDREDE